CQCAPAWRGQNCSRTADPCTADGVDCGKGFQCSRNTSSPVGYSCNCASKPGWRQHSAQSPRCVLYDACLAGQPCENGAPCTPAPAGGFTCKCGAAWSGPACNEPRDVCQTGDGRSLCGAEWTCERDTSRPAGYSCGCHKKPGWKTVSASEPQCEVADPCVALQPCRNGATCLATASDAYRCSCPPAWTGAACDQPLDPCTAAPCGDGFQCQRDPTAPAGFVCSCDAKPGWDARAPDDPRCVVRDQCLASSPCQNGGTCLQGTAREFQCNCARAWGGARCDQPRDPCESQQTVCGVGRTSEDPTCVVDDICLARAPCLNDGACTSLKDGRFQCTCRGLWKGATCAEPRHPCRERARCGRLFTCQLAPHSLAGYTCSCDAVPGYSAKSEADPRCEVTDVCLQRSPCQNGGSCESLPGLRYRCACPPAWKGDNCQTPASPCESPVELCAGAVGTCQRNPNSPLGFSCGCGQTPGWEASSDDDPHCVLADECLANDPCKNGATCTAQPRAGYTCSCQPAWTGATCEEPSSPCESGSDLCGAEFACARDAESALGYSCGCEARPGYRATSDTNPSCRVVDQCAALEPCQNGATCTPLGDSQFSCTCAAGWSGQT
ncbi:fibropellin-1-like, partial [Pollicipes pollicipes]|uniref:fibropellin-1-like n=1 Tax=Pollicipes pollicipes TaxID=41117 RepID=UPI0018852407